jgi:hypothetical protein
MTVTYGDIPPCFVKKMLQNTNGQIIVEQSAGMTREAMLGGRSHGAGGETKRWADRCKTNDEMQIQRAMDTQIYKM